MAKVSSLTNLWNSSLWKRFQRIWKGRLLENSMPFPVLLERKEKLKRKWIETHQEAVTWCLLLLGCHLPLGSFRFAWNAEWRPVPPQKWCSPFFRFEHCFRFISICPLPSLLLVSDYFFNYLHRFYSMLWVIIVKRARFFNKINSTYLLKTE